MEPLTVSVFLQALGSCWLLDEPFPADQLDLSQIANVAAAAECGELWKHVVAELARGSTVRSLSENATELGVLQLRLASSGQ